MYWSADLIYDIVDRYLDTWTVVLKFAVLSDISCIVYFVYLKFEWNWRHVIFKQILVIDGWGITGLHWLSVNIEKKNAKFIYAVIWIIIFNENSHLSKNPPALD